MYTVWRFSKILISAYDSTRRHTPERNRHNLKSYSLYRLNYRTFHSGLRGKNTFTNVLWKYQTGLVSVSYCCVLNSHNSTSLRGERLEGRDQLSTRTCQATRQVNWAAGLPEPLPHTSMRSVSIAYQNFGSFRMPLFHLQWKQTVTASITFSDVPRLILILSPRIEHSRLSILGKATN